MSARITFKPPPMFKVVVAVAWHKQFCPRAWTGVVLAEDSSDTCLPGRALDLVYGCVRAYVCIQRNVDSWHMHSGINCSTFLLWFCTSCNRWAILVCCR